MLFNSYIFFWFFLAVTCLYFTLPAKYRWALLLAASCYFYMYFIPYYILILLFTIVIDYYAGIWIDKQEDPRKRKNFLWISIAANVGVLAVFKYFNFFIDNFNQLSSLLGLSPHLPYLEIILPVGLSFHTFQAMSYTIEIYRGKFKPEKHFGIYALYVMYYPQLVAGPIERPQNILPQLHLKHSFDYDRLISGLQLMVFGLFKKVVIADRLALLVSENYNNPNASPFELLISAIFFSFQIYCDFSGYSDIALGSSRIMGIELMKNFNKPYFAKGISDFWARWHISLSTWFRDYVYIPLGGNRVAERIWIRNILIVFLLSGFWHGASWNFVVWGGLHAVLTIIEIYVKRGLNKFSFTGKTLIQNLMGRLLMFTSVTLAWVFFRITGFNDAIHILRKIGFFFKYNLYTLKTSGWNTTWNFIFDCFNNLRIDYTIAFTAILLLLLFDYFLNLKEKSVTNFKSVLLFSLLLSLIIIFGKTEEVQFIYFQF